MIQTALRNPATQVTRTKGHHRRLLSRLGLRRGEADADAGKLRNDRVLTVKTPLDSASRNPPTRRWRTLLRRLGDQYDVDEAGVVILDPDGALRAMVGGADYGEASSTAPPTRCAAGLLVQALCLCCGARLRPVQAGHGWWWIRPSASGNWCPQNYGRSYSGRQPMWLAVAKSINTIPIKVTPPSAREWASPTSGTPPRPARQGDPAPPRPWASRRP